MGWMQVLCDTFDNNAHMVGVTQAGKLPLPPVFHIIANAQIEITLSEDGTFVRAAVVPKNERATIIPVTETVLPPKLVPEAKLVFM